VFFSWLDERRRKRLLDTPFPDEWRRVLSRNMVHFGYLDAREQQHLCQLVQLFVAEKEWEGCNGLVLTDEMKVTIAGQACLLLLGLVDIQRGPELYANVETILVYPSTFIPRRQEESIFAIPGVEHPMLPLIGEAHRRGPVILTWDAVRRSGRHPGVGHNASHQNVVYHEFAHKLDMLDGAVDGVPPLGDPAEYERWNRVCKAEYERLRSLSDAGREGVLDPYGSTDEAEFFAFVTEAFFDAPIELADEYPALYEVLSAFYRQDTAARQRRALARASAPSEP
jgi:MtfA peptidase